MKQCSSKAPDVNLVCWLVARSKLLRSPAARTTSSADIHVHAHEYILAWVSAASMLMVLKLVAKG